MNGLVDFKSHHFTFKHSTLGSFIELLFAVRPFFVVRLETTPRRLLVIWVFLFLN